jgi:hypothetical protein
MDQVSYVRTQKALLSICRMVSTLPLDEYLAAINRAEVTGPILDPTLWQKGHEKMEQVKRLAEAVAHVQHLLVGMSEAAGSPATEISVASQALPFEWVLQSELARWHGDLDLVRLSSVPEEKRAPRPEVRQARGKG